MNLLLDTATFLWLVSGSEQLSPRVREEIRETSARVFLSSVSSWEIAVKSSLGKLPLPQPAATFVPAMRERLKLDSLPIDEESTLQLERLPSLHRDPFDRMLICQAIQHGLTLVTPDEQIHRYPVRVFWS